MRRELNTYAGAWIVSGYLLNYWYLAAWSDEVADKPLRRVFFDRPTVLYRGSGGAISALEDRCPHRFARLSAGRVIGDDLECPYHGLRFGPDGACSHNPFSNTAPSRAAVRSFPVVEDDGCIWIWPGDPEQARATPVPNFRFLRQKPSYELIRMYNYMSADFLLAIDNLMEHSHAGFLHRNSLSQGTDMLATFFRQGKYRGYEENGAVITRWDYSDKPHEWSQSRWSAPSTVLVSKGFDHNIPPNAVLLYGLHLFTPETPRSAHYFAIEPFDREVEKDPDFARKTAEFIGRKIFHDEDCVLLEHIQQDMGDVPYDDSSPVLLSIDAGAVIVRREYKRLLGNQTGRP
jgi:vanillate O-demethylase monooxygenase subunit